MHWVSEPGPQAASSAVDSSRPDVSAGRGVGAGEWGQVECCHGLRIDNILIFSLGVSALLFEIGLVRCWLPP